MTTPTTTKETPVTQTPPAELNPELSKARESAPKLKPFNKLMLNSRGNHMVTITPMQAQDLLDHHNAHNRPMKEAGVRRWTTEIKAGRWDPDASDIKVDWEGRLIDGQHRLSACVRAEMPIGTLIRTGLNPQTQRRVDVGIKRNTADTFKMEGIPWATNTAAGILLRIRYEEGEARGMKVTSKIRPDVSPDMALDYLREHPMHEKMTLPADRMYRIGPGIARTVWFAAMAMFAEQDEADAVRFSDAFLSGEWGGPGSPIQALVRFLSQARTPGLPGFRSSHVNERHLLALVKAWNAWRMQQPLDRLTVKDTDPFIPVV